MKSIFQLEENDFPGLYQAADAESLGGQRRYMIAVKLRLTAVILAAVSGMLASFVSQFAYVAAFSFFCALAVEIYLLKEKPERVWYDGRAVAESAKSITWRYAVGAAPYSVETSSAVESGDRFREEISKLLKDAPKTGIFATEAPILSDRVRELRSRSLKDRRATYLHGRIIDQQSWYAKKARFNEKRALAWRVALLSAEVVGFIAAIAYATQAVKFDLSGVVAASIGAGAAWLTARQHESLARAYAFTSNELSIVRDRLESIDHDNEQVWSEEVADAEEAISREHTMWRASRSSFS